MVGGQGRPYSFDEKKAIVKYIVEQNGYAYVKGNLMWKDMERHIPDRSWQSLREHFRKQIYSKLHHPLYGLTHEQIASFRHCFECKRQKRRVPEPDRVDDDSDETICELDSS